MQDFAARILAKCTSLKVDSETLQRVLQKSLKFKLVCKQRTLKANVNHSSQGIWIQKQVYLIMSSLLAMPDTEANLIVALNYIAKKYGFISMNKSIILLRPTPVCGSPQSHEGCHERPISNQAGV